MCYLGDRFAHDVFTTYSHGDPHGRGNAPLKQWTHELIIDLKADIDTQGYTSVDVCFDENLDPNLPLTKQLREEVKNSGLLLVIMSELWLRSVWCKDEIGWFGDEVKQRSGTYGYVILVRATTTITQWPDCLLDERGIELLGIYFHRKGHRHPTWPFGWRGIKGGEYVQALGDLASTVICRLDELREHGGLREADTRRVGQDIGRTPCLYLHAPADREKIWRETRKQLEEGGFSVKPIQLEQISSDKVIDAGKRRLDELKSCDGLVVLLADLTDDILAEISYCQADQKNVEANGRRLPCAVLNLTKGEVSVPIRVLRGYGRDWQLDVRAWLERAHTGEAPA